MREALRIALNCIAAAILSAGLFFLMVRWEAVLMTHGFKAVSYFPAHVPRPYLMPVIYLYDTFRFVVFGAICAALMVRLKPRKVWLYAAVSVITLYFATWAGMALRSKDTFSIVLAITWLATVPVLYFLFVRIARKRRKTSSI